MKLSLAQYWRRYLFTASSMVLIGACDVTPEEGGGDLGGGGGQSPDPVVVDYPIVYVERPIPIDEDGMFVPHDALDPDAFNPGARLMFKARASVPAQATDLSSEVFAQDPDDPNFDPAFVPLYDVKDVSASADGGKLLFSMRAPEDPDAGDDEQPTWNIWEYDRALDELRRIIPSDLTAEEGHDISASYLPNGDIIFSSTRQRRSKAILLDENKPQFGALVEGGDDEDEAFLIHIMDPDGLNIEQVTYNQSHDLYPSIIGSGELVFLRWDNANRRDRLSLYKSNPDGSNMTLLYGYNSQNTATGNSEGVFTKPIEMPDGRIMVNLRPRESEKLGGDMVMIDTETFIDNMQPTDSNPGMAGPAQESASVLPVTSDGSISSHGYFSSAYPMNDGTDRFLVSWSTCRVLGYALGIFVEATGNEDPDDPDQLYALVNDLGEYVDENGLVTNNAVFRPLSELSQYPCTENTVLIPDIIPEASPAYGIWIYDTAIATQSPVVLAEDNLMFTDAIVLEPKVIQYHIEKIDDTTENPDVYDYDGIYNQNLGVVHIRSVYDLDGTDTAPGGYNTLADPVMTMASERPARFIRLTKAVSMPSDDVYDFDNSAFGIGNPDQMKDILGYVPIEPDGSAMFKVPADVAFAITLLDENGKRISPRHHNWMTVRPGEVRQCNGCHTTNSTAPHGRFDAEPPSSNVGALSVSHFPNTVLMDHVGAPFSLPEDLPRVGETMAQYRGRVFGPRTPSVNIEYSDDWTDPALTDRINASFSYDYSGLVGAPPPTTTTGCATEWHALCRVVINYETHIQPLWFASRIVRDPNDPSIILADNTCTNCHSTEMPDPMDPDSTIAQIPQGNRQLDLSDSMSDVDNNYLTSFAELFLNDQAQELDENMLLQNEQVPLQDANGNDLYQAIDNTTGLPVNIPLDTIIEDIQLVIDGVPQYEASDNDILPGTFSYTDIQTIFDTNCVNCHTDDGRAPSGGLNLDADVSYTVLMDPANPIIAMVDDNGMMVVDPDPTNSLLIQRLLALDGFTVMPPGGALPNATINQVVSWIEFGAPQTGVGSRPCLPTDDCPDFGPEAIADQPLVPYTVQNYTFVLVDGLEVLATQDSGRIFGRILSPNGALASNTFFNVFEQGGGTTDHSTFLSPAELKFIAEWLDIGAQYYNNPFEAPAD